MANSQLYGSYFNLKSISKQIDELNHKFNGSAPTLSHIISTDNGEKPEYSISYSYAKKLKNYFDTHDYKDAEYLQKGGDVLKNFINLSLDSNRHLIYRTKRIKSNDGRENQFIKTHEKSFLKPTDMKNLKPGKGMEKITLTEKDLLKEDEDKKKYASVIIILNDNKELLIVKRADGDRWEAGKWALVGGKHEESEDKYEAILREVKEETNLELSNVIYLYDKKEGNFIVNEFFGVCKNPDDIKLNPEHSEYKWVKPSELTQLKSVPQLIDDITKGLESLKSKIGTEEIKK